MLNKVIDLDKIEYRYDGSLIDWLQENMTLTVSNDYDRCCLVKSSLRKNIIVTSDKTFRTGNMTMTVGSWHDERKT